MGRKLFLIFKVVGILNVWHLEQKSQYLQPWGWGRTGRPSLGSGWWSHSWLSPDRLSSPQHQSDRLCSAPWPPQPANRGNAVHYNSQYFNLYEGFDSDAHWLRLVLQEWVISDWRENELPSLLLLENNFLEPVWMHTKQNMVIQL